MSTRSRLVILAALVTAAFAPGAAHAATTCFYDPNTHGLTATMTTAGDAATISRSGSLINVNGANCGATTSNTAWIVWNDTSLGGTAAAVDLSGGPIGPGFNPPAGDTSPTIKMYDYGKDGSDTFEVFGSAQDDSIHIGTGAFDGYVNLDVAADQGSPTFDVDLTDVEIADINGGGGNDVIDASAHSETGAYGFKGMLYEEGALGNDHLTTGFGPAEISGGADNDTLAVGGVGQTTIKPGMGDDTVTGEPLANDTVDYGDSAAGVNVDLRRSDRQATGGSGNDQLTGLRRITGSSHADTLAGTEGADVIQGGGGDDVLMGRNGDDTLIGGAGNNIVSYADPSPGVTTGVSVSLASQLVAQDTVSEGKDTLSGISGIIGSPFADVLIGDGTANRIDGGGGPDLINAGDGPDTLLLRDGVADHAECGGGVDSVASDLQGIDALTNCENVTFDAAPSAPGGSGTGGSSTGPVAIADTTLTFRFTARKHQRLGKRGLVKGSLLCPDEACSGDVSAKLAIGHPARRSVYRTVAIAAGKAKVIKIRLGARSVRRARAALHAGRKVTVRVTAVARDAAGNRRTVTRKVVLRA